MRQDKLNEILDKHRRWLNNLSGGERANLRNADLGSANLRNADLRNANLRNADLGNANLRDANLRDADLRNAYLWNADLRNAYLWNADLRYAELENSGIHKFDNYYLNSTGLYKPGIYGYLNKIELNNLITKLFEDIAKDLAESSDM